MLFQPGYALIVGVGRSAYPAAHLSRTMPDSARRQPRPPTRPPSPAAAPLPRTTARRPARAVLP